MSKRFVAVLALVLTTPCPSDLRASQDDQGPVTSWEYLAGKYDADGDGQISREEYSRDDAHWQRLDKNGDGVVVEEELAGEGPRQRRGGRGGRGGRIGPGGRLATRGAAPREGNAPPDFHLQVLSRAGEHAKKEVEGEPGDLDKPAKPEMVRLSDFQRKRPVALIFGSYT